MLYCGMSEAAVDNRDATNAGQTSTMPVVFVGHGSPMNAITSNPFSDGFTELGRRLPRPRAVLAISAHWEANETLFSSNARPRTIHDFGGFPPELHAVQYPAPGATDLAERATTLVGDAHLSDEWGLDHGTWSVLKWMYPAADVPVFQMSLRRDGSPQSFVDLGRALAPLRDEGVLILGTGNITHNLQDAFSRMRSGDFTTPAWASRFDAATTRALNERDTEALVALCASDDGRIAQPTPEHFLPLLCVYGASASDERPQFFLDAFDVGSISMRSVIFGGG